MRMVEEYLERARAVIQASSKVVFLTGAGISTSSGIPDFRGPNGMWTKNPAAEKMSDIRFYMNDPNVRKAAWRSRMVHPAWAAKPNAAHLAIAAFENTGKLSSIITQNIDNLHQSAGSTEKYILEVHGTIHKVVCMQCKKLTPMWEELERVKNGEEDPACLDCGGILKSATISFGQALDEETIHSALEVSGQCDLLICIGTTLQVYPIAGAVDIAHRAGAKIIIVNAEPTQYDQVSNFVFRGDISEVVPALLSNIH